MGEPIDSDMGATLWGGGSPLPFAELERIHKMTMRMAFAAALIALAGLSPIGGVLYAVGVCLGLAIGVWNLRALEGSLTRIEPDTYKEKRRRFAMSRMGRLGVITIMAVILLVAVRNVGLGLVLGVGVFYAIMLANMIYSLARARRQSLAAEPGSADD
ncbi:MAG TPA: hypothetical protein VMU77_06820 [Acidimicrobiales bacterium]|nr:hypothetical protein [Acidimicrobiales bacterium]